MKIKGNENPDYAVILSNLALMYLSKRDYNSAEPLYLEALKIWDTTIGENNTDYALTAKNLASLYKSKGDYAKAEVYHIAYTNVAVCRSR